MTRKELANWIHEWNLPCKFTGQGEKCMLCMRIASQVMLAQATELQKAALVKP